MECSTEFYRSDILIFRSSSHLMTQSYYYFHVFKTYIAVSPNFSEKNRDVTSTTPINLKYARKIIQVSQGFDFDKDMLELTQLF